MYACLCAQLWNYFWICCNKAVFSSWISSIYMILKEFQVHVPAKGTVNVEFYVHFGEHGATAGEIKIHADYNCGIPHKVQLKKDDGIWKLYDDHPKMVNGEIKVVPEFLEDELSMTIASRIQQIKEDA